MNIIVFFNFIIFVFLSLKPIQNELVNREQTPPMINNKKILSLYTRSELLKGGGILLLYPFFYLAKSLCGRNRREQSKSFSLLPLLVSSGIYLTSHGIRLKAYFHQAKKLNTTIINNGESIEIKPKKTTNQRKKSFNNKILSFFNIFQKTNTENIKNCLKDMGILNIQKDIDINMENTIRELKNQENKNEKLYRDRENNLFEIQRFILNYDNVNTFRYLACRLRWYLDSFKEDHNLKDYYTNQLKKLCFSTIQYAMSEHMLNKMFFLILRLKNTAEEIEEFITIIKNRIENRSFSLTQKTINSALLTFRETYMKDIEAPEAEIILFDHNVLFPLFKTTTQESNNSITRIINLLFIKSHHFFVDREINSKGDPLIKFLKDNNITYKMIRDDIQSNMELDEKYKAKILLKIDYLKNLLSE